MTSPDQEPTENMPPRQGYATPAEVTAFVDDAVVAFYARGTEFAATSSHYEEAYSEEVGAYVIDGIGYDPQLTPNLTPYDTCDIEVVDIRWPGAQSYVLVHFATAVPTPEGSHRLDRTVTFWKSGDIDDVTRDYAEEERTRDPHEPRAPKSMSKEDIHNYMEYLLGKEALRETRERAEGLPKVTPQITREEIADLQKLFPAPLPPLPPTQVI